MEGDRRTTSRTWHIVMRRVIQVSVAAVLAASTAVAAPVARVVPPDEALAASTFVDPFFREFTVFSGLTRPMTVRFATDGRAFVGEKAGLVKAFDSITDTTPTTVIDLRTDVNSYWDRGLLGIALDTDFLATRPYLYLFFVYDAPPGGTAPVWNDTCLAAPNGPGGTLDGCPVTSRVERITIDRTTNVAVPGSRALLLHDFCQQFPSHSGGGIGFGPDKQLYVAAGDGASFNTSDYGQRGGTVPDPANPYVTVNPCGDPVTVTSAPGATPTVDVATAQGGALRAQDIRTTTDPVGLSGSIVRINPDTGLASAGNPLASNADLNARRVVAHGFRNPFRLTFRPGTSDLYIANVGNQTWEEIERVQVPTSTRTPTTLPNFGWPCYEGPAKASSFQALNTGMCNALYAQGSAAVTGPLYTYAHSNTRSPTGPCFVPDVNGRMGSAPTGVAFYTGPSGAAAAYPSAYAGGLFFVDYTRDCLAVIPAGTGGVPDASKAAEVARGISNPVDLVTGPGGDLYYVDIDGGRVIRVRYVKTPTARATATPSMARAPVTIQLDGTGSTSNDPGFPLTTYRWDLDDDGAYDDATGATHAWNVTSPAVYPVSLEVVSGSGLTDTVDLVVDTTNDPPVPVIQAPTAALQWSVGDVVAFSGSATDPQDGALPPSALSWDLVMLHCPADCHEHVVETFEGVASGSFDAPDHEYPSHLELRLSATDTHGTTRRTTVELMPRTATISVTSTPSGVPISVGGDPVTTPSTTTVLRNGITTVSPPLATTIGGKRHRFSRWADSLTRVRDIVASGPVSLAATFVPDAPDTCATATTSSRTGVWLTDRTSGNGDSDWYRFSLTSNRRVVVTLGNLPVDARLDLYGSCSTLLATSNGTGLRYEEITRVLAKGTYRVRVSIPSNTWSGDPYLVRFRPLSAGLVIKSSRTTAGAGGGGLVRIVGEVVNNSGSTRGRVTVKATFRNASGSIVRTLSGTGFARRFANGDITSFVVSGSVPAYTTVSYAVTSGSVPASRSLKVTSITATRNLNGTVTETGVVRNTGTTTATSVGIARTWYGRLGEVLDRGVATVSPSTLAPGKSGTFTVLRPVLPTAMGARTQLRGS